jgi:hypothetical protein
MIDYDSVFRVVYFVRHVGPQWVGMEPNIYLYIYIYYKIFIAFIKFSSYFYIEKVTSN